MYRIVLAVVITVALALLTGTVGAETHAPRIQQRENRQQQRIEQGEQSGSLTRSESARLEAQQVKISRDEQQMASDGNLSTAERKKLTREQNRANRAVYRKQHNQRTATGQ